MRRLLASFAADPRHYQIATLGSLLVYGLTVLDFDIAPGRCLVIIAAALLTQFVCGALTSQKLEPRSALISALSLCLLLRTNFVSLLILGAVIAIATKYVFRVNNKHLFNPTNIAIVALLLVTDSVWVSPAQWGNVGFFAFLMACAGGLVVHRALRSDVTYAFLFTYLALVFGRAAWLGDPLAIPFHKLQSGSLLLFAFFMISDPRTTPNARVARIAFGAVTALGGWYLQTKMFIPEGLLYALAACSVLTPLIDRLVPGVPYTWSMSRHGAPLPLAANVVQLLPRSNGMKKLVVPVLALAVASNAWPFCGFYVAKADTKLFNKASQVVIVHSENRHVLTMANDFKGDPKEFAIVVPVPTVLQRKQINVADKALIDHLDAYTSPRLVEYFDDDPCVRRRVYAMAPSPTAAAANESVAMSRAKSLGVTIEAKYSVGEYDILILSAKQSGGLATWLTENGYKLPPGAGPILGSYIKQNMKFFVAKVNLKEQSKLGFTYLRPLQIAFESPKFMLPIRLGTLNANGPQELFIYTLTRKGRVETTNYRTVKLPTGDEIPPYVKNEFGNFYKAMFSEQVRKENMRAVFLEYAWDMNWCDPCAADPLSNEQLRKLGVFWIDKDEAPQPGWGGPAPVNAFVTRLHVRYDAAHFPEDLAFQETSDRNNFQARYVLRHPWKGDSSCAGAQRYREQLPARLNKEAETLARLTGWNINDIRRKMKITQISGKSETETNWWESLWE